MEESTSKEKVLKYIREALISKTDQPFPKIEYEKSVFREMEESPDVNFAQELTNAGGLFIYCESEEEVIGGIKYLMKERQWESIFALEPSIISLLGKGNINCISDHSQLTGAQVGMTGCEALVARLGSVLISTGQMAGRKIFIYPEIHLVLAYASQIVPDLKDAFIKLRKKYEQKMPSMVTLITGPSRTADIEKTLVMGAHGPKELLVFMLEDRL
jgi:L-lactate dehydrogenase complex protein LldG